MTRTSRETRTVAATQLLTEPRRPEPALLTRVRLRARRRVLWLRRLWADAAPAGAGPAPVPQPWLGLAISHQDVDRALADPDALARMRRAFDETDPEARALAPAVAAADRAAAADPSLERMRRAFSLSEHEVDLLSLAASVEANPGMHRVIGYLHDDATLNLATPWLARELFDWPPEVALGPDSALVRWRLALPAESAPSPWSGAAPWEIDPHAASWLLHGRALDPRIARAARLVLPADDAPRTCLYPAELAAMAGFVRALRREDARMAVILAGAPGAGRRTLAAQLCAALGLPLLVADGPALLGAGIAPPAAAEAAVQVARSARLAGAAVYWHEAEAVAAASRDLDAVVLTFLGVSGAGAVATAPGAARLTIPLPALSRAARAQLWSDLSPHPIPPPVLDWPLLPADLVRASAVAPAGVEAVREACRAALPVDAAALASRLARPYRWDDLVVAPSVRSHLAEFEAQARHRWPVYEEWGFERLCPMGRGITALFAGPSGTGKTMSAQILARSLEMEIYRVDLATVMSKYIGETEKNLRQIFDACDRANVLLFFDEADALFGQRTQVKDAHDRYANVEIDYLLQRMERFDGIAVLATNRRGDIDPAFLRRVRFLIDFLAPGVEERRALWRLALAERTPGGEPLLGEIDWERLAQRLDLTGADIKAAAMNAAFLARAEGERIGMKHLLHAARRELTKRGVVLRDGGLAE